MNVHEIIKKLRNIKFKPKTLVSVITASVSAILLAALIAFAVTPSVITVCENYNAKACKTNAYRLINRLGDILKGDKENKVWYDLIGEKNSGKLLSALNEQLDKKVNVSNYYLKFGGDDITVLCRMHPKITGVSVDIPNNVIGYDAELIEPASDVITSVEVSGRDIYFQNSILDAANPEKMKFTADDDLTALFPDIKAIAHYEGGGQRTLETNEYKIKAKKLDMRKSGRKKLNVTYVGGGQNMEQDFEIYVIDNKEREPLIVDGGNFGVYELASWVWTDYVADALNAEGEHMDFDASIVFDNGQYYYYPDGFAIIKDSDKNGTIEGARNIDNHKKEAYYIEFRTDKVVNGKNISDASLKDGYLKAADSDKIYIWQSKPSKELPKGWITVYCEKKKLK